MVTSSSVSHECPEFYVVSSGLLFVCCFPGVTTHCGCIFHNPIAGFSLLVFEVSWSHTTTRHSRYDSSGRVINPSQRHLPDNTQHSQQTNIHALGGIWTHDRSRRAAEDLRLRPHGVWDRLFLQVQQENVEVEDIHRPRPLPSISVLINCSVFIQPLDDPNKW
jgi:hypothetical protein